MQRAARLDSAQPRSRAGRRGETGLTYGIDVDPIESRDAIVYAAPMSHGAGIYVIPHVMPGVRHVVPASGDLLAFVVPRPGAQLAKEDLDARCVEHIGRFKRPKRYEIVGSLPKNNYGKVLKGELREQLREQAR